MTRTIGDRVGAASGVVGTALTFAGLMITNRATESISVTDAPAAIAVNYDLNREQIRLGVTLALAGVFFAFWFLASLRQRLRRAERDDGYLHAVAFAGGTIGFAGVLTYLAILLAATNDAISIAPETARSMLVLGWEYAGVLAPPFAALIGAASLGVIRYRLLPAPARVLAWLGLPLALVLAGSGFFGGFFVVLGLIWLFALSVAFLTPDSRPRRETALEAAAA